MIDPKQAALVQIVRRAIGRIAKDDEALEVQMMLGLSAAMIAAVMKMQGGELADIVAAKVNDCWAGDVPFQVVPVRGAGEPDALNGGRFDGR